MGELKQTLLLLSLSLFLCAVLESVLPPSPGKRAFRLLCGVAIFSVAASCFSGVELKSPGPETWFSSALLSAEELNAENEKAILFAAEEGWKAAACEALEKEGVPFSAVKARCELTKNAAELLSLRVAGVPEGEREKAREALRSVCGAIEIEWSTEVVQ